MADVDRTPPVSGLYPTVLLGDGQWDRVIHALYQRNTKADAALARRIVKQVEKFREQARQRELDERRGAGSGPESPSAANPGAAGSEGQECSLCEGEGVVAANFSVTSAGTPAIVPCPDCRKDLP